MNQEQVSPEATESKEQEQPAPRIVWDNPDTLAGDAPAMSRGPLIASIVVYAGWFIFLVIMAYMRVSTTSQ
ncbi:MAG: hypothetical protein DHS20C16_13860 [Phycisphaerae bacterium]|nr:MAG: hypothetical protein DHS20C16_13860 [Phycisphaerae bacterium]